MGSYIFTFEDGSKALMHHGTDGMKWGVWSKETRQKYVANPELLPKTVDIDDVVTSLKNSHEDFERALAESKKGQLNDEQVSDVARKVIRGDYGAGAVRMKMLSDAGYDYDQIQSRVNDIIYGRRS